MFCSKILKIFMHGTETSCVDITPDHEEWIKTT